MINLNGVNYYYEIEGNGEPLVLLHGFTGDHTTWKNSNLKQYFQVITIDIIGHGATDSPESFERYSMKQVANDLATLLKRLDIKQINLLGYSMGGRLALSFAMYYPKYIKRLVLESSSPGLKTAEERKKRISHDEKLANMIRNEGITKFVNYWGNIPLFASQKNLPKMQQEAIRKQRLRNSPIGLANSLRGMGTGIQPSWWEQLDSVEFPVLLLAGALDEKFCRIANEMNNKLQNGQVVIFPNVGHTIHVEEPAAFDRTILHFIEHV